jgi:hypothetical protein
MISLRIAKGPFMKGCFMKTAIAVLMMMMMAQISLASNNDSPTECMKAISQALSIGSGQKLMAKASTCELHVSYNQQNYQSMLIDFWVLLDLQTDPQKIHDGVHKYEMVSWMDDQVNGSNAYDISRCEVSADQIRLKYTRKQTSGWHSKYKYSVQISLKNGQATSATVQGDSSKTESCTFSD